MYTVKTTYTSAQGDALKLHLTNGAEVIHEALIEMYTSGPPPDSENYNFCVLMDSLFFCSADRSYAESYLTWSSEKEFQRWVQWHNEDWAEYRRLLDVHNQSVGVVVEMHYPPSDDHDWLATQPPGLEQVSISEVLFDTPHY
jgi:hypothetical protein